MIEYIVKALSYNNYDFLGHFRCVSWHIHGHVLGTYLSMLSLLESEGEQLSIVC